MAQKRPNWPKTGIFGQISAFLDHLISWPTKRRCKQGAITWVTKLLLPLIKIRNFDPTTAQFGQKLAVFGPFGPTPEEKTMRARCVGGLSLCGYQNFCFLPKSRFLVLIFGCGAQAVSPKTPIYFKYSKWLFKQCVFVLNFYVLADKSSI